MSCVSRVDICVIRGDLFSIEVGLDGSWEEVLATPDAFTANLVFREAQDDTLTPYLTLTTDPEITENPCLPDPPIFFRFRAAPSETQALPEWNHVAYCELVDSSGVEIVPRRLFNSNVRIHD
jgi:hypothetical protein